jgi:hypothetical protein
MFKTFPEFSKPSIADRAAYNELIRSYPPYADLSFAMLMTWWNTLDSVAISMLNDNLVISYWLPGDEKHSGLSLIGKNMVDESICTLFDHFHDKGEPARLVHVPEFVTASIRHPELFKYTEEREYDECVISLRKLEKQIKKAKQSKSEGTPAPDSPKKIEVKIIDLGLASSRHLLLETHTRWRNHGAVNYTLDLVEQTMPVFITQGKDLGAAAIGLFIDSRLQAFLLYQKPSDKKYVIIDFLQMNAAMPGLFDVVVYQFVSWFIAEGFRYANLDADLGLPLLRSMRLSLGPVNFLRKYTIEPTTGKGTTS